MSEHDSDFRRKIKGFFSIFMGQKRERERERERPEENVGQLLIKVRLKKNIGIFSKADHSDLQINKSKKWKRNKFFE